MPPMPKAFNVLAFGVLILSALFLIALSHDYPPFPFKESYQLTLLNNKEVSCQQPRHAFNREKLLLSQCNDHETYYLKNYYIQNPCFLECPKRQKDRISCYEAGLTFNPQDHDNIILKI